MCWDQFRKPAVSALARLTFWTGQLFVVGAVLCIVRYLRASVASTHQMSIALPPCDNGKHLQTLLHFPPRGKNHPLRTTALQVYFMNPRAKLNIIFPVSFSLPSHLSFSLDDGLAANVTYVNFYLVSCWTPGSDSEYLPPPPTNKTKQKDTIQRK